MGARTREIASGAFVQTVAFGTFTPYRTDCPASEKGCLTCTHFQGRFYCGHVLCERD